MTTPPRTTSGKALLDDLRWPRTQPFPDDLDAAIIAIEAEAVAPWLPLITAAIKWSKSNPPDRARLDFILRGECAKADRAYRALLAASEGSDE